MAPGPGPAVAGWIPVTAATEVGRGRRLGQPGEVGDPLEVHQGGKAHRSRALDGGVGSTERLVGARP
jgi:hypothetical protein